MTEEKSRAKNYELLNFSNCKYDLQISANVCKKILYTLIGSKMIPYFENHQ